jgi:hypothetical protein
MEMVPPAGIKRQTFNSLSILPPSLIHTSMPDGYLDFFNQTWLQYVGQPLEDLQGWKWTEFIHPEDLEGIVERWRASLAFSISSNSTKPIFLAMPEISRRRTDEFGVFVAVLKFGAVDFEDGARVPQKSLSRRLDHSSLAVPVGPRKSKVAIGRPAGARPVR